MMAAKMSAPRFIKLRPRAGFLLLGAILFADYALAREEARDPAQVNVHAGRAGCSGDLDGSPAGKTDAQGNLTVRNVEPTDHYLHLRCEGDAAEAAYFVSPRPGATAEVRAEPVKTEAPQGTSLEAAEAKMKLRRLIQEAVQWRAKGQFEEAVQRLRYATQLDPKNSDLHRELGITFLLAKDWKRARAEMLEAIRHKPDDADAHNGLGYSLEKLGDVDQALQQYRTATHLEPDDPEYLKHYLEALGKQAAQQAEKKK